MRAKAGIFGIMTTPWLDRAARAGTRAAGLTALWFTLIVELRALVARLLCLIAMLARVTP